MTGVTKARVADDEDGLRLDRWFKRHFPGVAFGQLSKLMRTGQIRLDGKRAKPGDRIAAGQEIRIPPIQAPDRSRPARPRPKVSAEEAARLRDLVLYKDDQVIALNKPPGLPVQGGTGTTRHLDGMLDALRFDADDRPRLVHRLDKDTSGVLLLGRTASAAASLTAAFRSRDALKTYWALVKGVPRHRRARIKLAMDKLPGKGGERMVATEDGKSAVTDYAVVDTAARKAAWLALRPHTGRTHQLRLHCAELGTPIVGDGKYGGRDAYLTGAVSRKLHLHARSISLPRPDGRRLTVTAPLPEHMAQSWALLGFEPDDAADPFDEEGA